MAVAAYLARTLAVFAGRLSDALPYTDALEFQIAPAFFSAL
jgi:hypothetical protein